MLSTEIIAFFWKVLRILKILAVKEEEFGIEKRLPQLHRRLSEHEIAVWCDFQNFH